MLYKNGKKGILIHQVHKKTFPYSGQEEDSGIFSIFRRSSTIW